MTPAPTAVSNKPIAIEKTLISIYCSNSGNDAKNTGRLIVEHPYTEVEKAVPSTVYSSSTWLKLEQDLSVSILPFDAPSVQELVETGKRIKAYGILGVLDLPRPLSSPSCPYLVIIKERKLAGTLQRHKLWRIINVDLIPIGTRAVLSAEEGNALQSVLQIFNSGLIFYSKTYDLTHSLQHQSLSSSGGKSDLTMDDRFYFNHHLSIPLLAVKEARPWCIKVIAGFAGSIDVECQGSIFTTTLISRLSNRRMGTRYLSRGLSLQGHPANNAETEQLVFPQNYHDDSTIASFVQVRGSAPAIWRQELDLSYRPRLDIEDSKDVKNWNAVSAHFKDLLGHYCPPSSSPGRDRSRIICINLLDTEGFEAPLTNEYEENVGRYGDSRIEYESFSVSKWCKGMKYENMEVLVTRVEKRLVENSFFLAKGKVPSLLMGNAELSNSDPNRLSIIHIQTGVVRVSCLDSLDRTNLTCSLFAKTMIKHQCSAILAKNVPIPLTLDSVHPFDERSLRELTAVWADNGDSVSLLYAGTGALKADVTRTGKRQLRGNVDDFINALTRYYLNNVGWGVMIIFIMCLVFCTNFRKVLQFNDGRKQDALDLILRKSNTDPSISPKPTKSSSIIVKFITTLQSIAPTTISTVFEFIVAMFIFIWILGLVSLFRLDGRQFVTRPKSLHRV